MAHFAGLVAAGLHPNPVPFADVVVKYSHVENVRHNNEEEEYFDQGKDTC